jgi:hypothetical protein
MAYIVKVNVRMEGENKRKEKSERANARKTRLKDFV